MLSNLERSLTICYPWWSVGQQADDWNLIRLNNSLGLSALGNQKLAWGYNISCTRLREGRLWNNKIFQDIIWSLSGKRATCIHWSGCNKIFQDVVIACWYNFAVYHMLMLFSNIFMDKLVQYHGCWCPGYLHYQGISSHDINYLSSLVTNFNNVKPFQWQWMTWNAIIVSCFLKQNQHDKG